MDNVEAIWETFKNTESFLVGIRESCVNLEPGERDIVSTTWTDSPVEVDVTRLEDKPDTLEIRPMFFGETLNLSPAVTHFLSPSSASKHKL